MPDDHLSLRWLLTGPKAVVRSFDVEARMTESLDSRYMAEICVSGRSEPEDTSQYARQKDKESEMSLCHATKRVEEEKRESNSTWHGQGYIPRSTSL